MLPVFKMTSIFAGVTRNPTAFRAVIAAHQKRAPSVTATVSQSIILYDVTSYATSRPGNSQSTTIGAATSLSMATCIVTRTSRTGDLVPYNNSY